MSASWRPIHQLHWGQLYCDEAGVRHVSDEGQTFWCIASQHRRQTGLAQPVRRCRCGSVCQVAPMHPLGCVIVTQVSDRGQPLGLLLWSRDDRPLEGASTACSQTIRQSGLPAGNLAMTRSVAHHDHDTLPQQQTQLVGDSWLDLVHRWGPQTRTLAACPQMSQCSCDYTCNPRLNPELDP